MVVEAEFEFAQGLLQPPRGQYSQGVVLGVLAVAASSWKLRLMGRMVHLFASVPSYEQPQPPVEAVGDSQR